MCHFKIFTVISMLCICVGLWTSMPASADGDPTELPVSEVKDNLLPDEKEPMGEEAVATVTADGEFLLPTYLLPGETATVTRTTTTEKVVEVPAKKVAVQVASVSGTAQDETIQTIIRPTSVKSVAVPQVAPKAVQPVVDEADDLEQLLEQTAPVLGVNKTPVKGTIKPTKRLLIPLAQLPSVPAAEPLIPSKEQFIVPNTYATQMTDSVKTGEQLPFLMPHDIRITFYPRMSSFSGQSLKWVRAFATVALQDPRLIVEIRASCAEADLQNARIALIKGAMQATGLSKHQIRTVYTNRPVDTILLRAIPRPEKVDTVMTQKDKPLPKSLSRVQKW